MTEKRQLGKVKLRVRGKALLLREFTLEQMVKATGLNQESVQSELRRMRNEGFLTSQRVESEGQRGAPPCLYRLTSDPELRLELSQQVEEFYPETPPSVRPTSPHYFTAIDLLDQVERGNYSNTERTLLLGRSADALEFAWHDEGEPEGVINAFIECERGRLEYLRGNYDEAEATFMRAVQTFAENGMSEQYSCGGEYLPALIVRREWERQADTRLTEPEAQLVSKAESAATSLGDFGSQFATRHPMTRLLLDLSEQLLKALKHSLRERVLAEAKAKVWEVGTGQHETLFEYSSANQPELTPRGRPVYAVLKSQFGYRDLVRSDELEPCAWTHHLNEAYGYQAATNLGFVALNSPVPRGLRVSGANLLAPSWVDAE